MHIHNPKTTNSSSFRMNSEKKHIRKHAKMLSLKINPCQITIGRLIEISKNKTVKSIQKKRYYETIKKAGFRAEDKRAKFEMNGGMERGARGAKVAGAFEQSGGISGPLRFGLGIVARNGSGRKRRRG